MLELLDQKKEKKQRPDQSEYFSLSHEAEAFIAETEGVSRTEVQLAALARDIVPERYSRNQKILSCEHQSRLLSSRVAIIGCGGLGGTVIEILARIGIGSLTLVDGDVFEESNLNRQVLSSVAVLGMKKVEVARDRVRAVNPAVNVRAQACFFNDSNGHKLLENADLAIDCLDTLPDRFILEKACCDMNIPLISAAIGGVSGQAMVIYPGDDGFSSVYGAAKASPKKGVEASLGTLAFAAVYMAAVESAEAVTLALGKESPLRHTLFVADVDSHITDTFKLPKS